MNNTITLIGEIFTCSMIFALPFLAAWAYYIFTGDYMDFGHE